ncbi:uncharacterized protein FOMMEDRAFT_126677 [Fomitiporia mediterranea MF3/22]|uniref:uncharacterized protein n=1 Tax=Fomitiporia mediterranea (strain MF3/22) TaxID=694068 RepID=UPI0004409CCE|nr:uncharacterized protein FOMMEDRAFT_126677 [Fomitiporia mediterranea MF3/22]EJD01616.1 hypothetical protein FOMMEDRAFT_126677 [Fomitiporia mediterranea MF3/22]
MPLNPSPRKVVPLNSGDDGPSRRPAPTLTLRAFFCGVVVEGPDDANDLPEDVKDLVSSLGERMPSDRVDEEAPQTPASSAQVSPPGEQSRPRALTNTSALADLINELVSTERNYVQRLRMLKNSYADPLRSYARSKDTAIIAAYEAKILFGNIDQLVPINEAFLQDLERMASPNGLQTVGGVSDVALYHFKELRAFECYKQYYAKREEAQAIFKREMAKKSSTGFAAFVERIKYSTNDAKNRVGLRELLMEPVQRIPRYTLLFRSMIKLMGASDPQRAKLMEADEIASRIALAETDSHTRLAATLNCLALSIDGFPPALISSNRRFIDCIDVVDNLSDAAGLSSSGSFPSNTSSNSTPISSSNAAASLHCTLFLFDDKLMIVKRPGTDKPGRSLACLDDVERLASGGGIVSGRGRGIASRLRSVMTCKGVVDITDVSVTDISGADMHLYLESPPLDQTDRWAGRPFRVFSTVLPGTSYVDTGRLEREKKRFLENLWRVQARYRTKHGQSVALRAEDQEVESRGGKITVARTYFNVYQRTRFLTEAKKTKIVLHIDSLGDADPLLFGMDGPPYVVIRVRPIPGDLCRYSVLSCDPDEEPDEDVVQSARIPSRVIQTIHQYGLFKFKTDNPSRPATPSGGNRSRAHIFGLDVISRNLFGTSRSKDSSNDSMSRHRRSKSALSRSSTLGTDSTGTVATADSSTRFSHRTTSTLATSVSSFAVDDSSLNKRNSRSRKLVKRNRSRSPATTLADDDEYLSENEPGNESLTRRRARSMSEMRSNASIEYSDHEDADTTMLDFRERGRVTESEMDLSMRLELARRNSRNQHGRIITHDLMDIPVEEVIYEEEPPLPTTRPVSRASRRLNSVSDHGRRSRSRQSTSPQLTARSVTPTPGPGYESPRKGRAESFTSNRERRPIGPRAPSPSPFAPTSPTRMSPERPRTPEDEELLENTFDDQEMFTSTMIHEATSRIPRSNRQPYVPLQSTPKGKSTNATDETPGIVPLSIKKKALPTPSARRPFVKDSPLTNPNSRIGDNHAALQRMDSCNSVSEADVSSMKEDLAFSRDLVRVAETTREDLESSHRALKRIKLEVNALPARITQDSPKAPDLRSKTPSRGLVPTSSRTNAVTKEAEARMEEMFSMIGQRKGGLVAPRAVRANTIGESNSSGSQRSISSSADASEIRNYLKALDEIVSDAESDLGRTVGNYAKVEDGINRLVSSLQDRTKNLENTSLTLKRAKRQCELLKELLSNATAENEILYGSFNEELEGMFQDVTLPADEAWVAMTADLSETKKERFRLSKENNDLKRQLRETELQRDEWAALLRHHGLIP